MQKVVANSTQARDARLDRCTNKQRAEPSDESETERGGTTEEEEEGARMRRRTGESLVGRHYAQRAYPSIHHTSKQAEKEKFEEAERRSRRSTVEGRRSGAGGQRSEVGSRRSEVGGRRSAVGGGPMEQVVGRAATW